MHPACSCRTLGQLTTRLAACNLCAGAQSAPIFAVRPGQRALIVGQAPGLHEPSRGRPFAADAGRRLRSWFAPYGLDDETAFRATFAMSAVMKCYPGRVASSRGDRRPARDELDRCAPWTDATLRLLDPPLVIPVGSLAIEALLGRSRLADTIGRAVERDGRVYVPLPHPSGASAWLNNPAHRALVTGAIAEIAARLGRARIAP